jgi:hypothetical protein
LGIFKGMKKTLLGLMLALFLAPMLPAANAQVVVDIGHQHHRHRHCYWHHHHRVCRWG